MVSEAAVGARAGQGGRAAAGRLGRGEAGRAGAGFNACG